LKTTLPAALLLGLSLSLAGAADATPETNALWNPHPAPSGIPAPGPATDQPYAPQPVVPGGVILTVYPPGSPVLNAARVREPEQYTLTRGVPGRIQTIVNVHNPSLEIHTVEPGNNTGAAVILCPGGGHSSLVVGSEGADFVSFFRTYGVNTAILRYRLRRDGYSSQKDAVNDALQGLRLLRARAAEFGLDPKKIGIVGFSAGAELSSPAAVFFPDFDRTNQAPGDPLGGVTSRPDFVGVVYPGPTPFARNANPPVPRDAPPSFITCAGPGDRGHAVWAMEYYNAMLQAGVPNLEMHLYGNGVHGNGLKDRDGTPFGTWPLRFIDWFRDLGFLGKPGVETKAARDLRRPAR